MYPCICLCILAVAEIPLKECGLLDLKYIAEQWLNDAIRRHWPKQHHLRPGIEFKSHTGLWFGIGVCFKGTAMACELLAVDLSFKLRKSEINCSRETSAGSELGNRPPAPRILLIWDLTEWGSGLNPNLSCSHKLPRGWDWRFWFWHISQKQWQGLRRQHDSLTLTKAGL